MMEGNRPRTGNKFTSLCIIKLFARQGGAACWGTGVGVQGTGYRTVGKAAGRSVPYQLAGPVLSAWLNLQSGSAFSHAQFQLELG